MAAETATISRDSPTEILSRAGRGRTIATYRAKQKIFSQGNTADSVFFILKGRVKRTVMSEHGKEAVVAILGKHDFFGEGCMTDQKYRTATATAMTECEVMRLEKGGVDRALHDQPAFADIFVKHLLSREARAEEDLSDQLFNSTEKRLARALLLLANYGKEGEPGLITARVSQQTLAEMIRTTRSQVSHFMNKFRKLGLISYDGQIEVHKSLLHLVLHEQPEIRM
jgi:CRP-like cAMP-binding protein